MGRSGELVNILSQGVSGNIGIMGITDFDFGSGYEDIAILQRPCT